MKNPNNCPIKATFFISDSNNKTSYCLIRNLYENGHEIALSTLKYTVPQLEQWDFKNWTQQILDMRKNLEKFAAIPRPDLIGFRAPFLQPSANVHYRVIASHNFLYDSSLIVNSKNILWPFTLDYLISSSLDNNGPTESFRGIWEIPTQRYYNAGIKKLQPIYCFFFFFI